MMNFNYITYQSKPLVGVTWIKNTLHFIKVMIFLIIATLVLVFSTKGEITMNNFNDNFVNLTISYMISIVAGVRPVT